MVSCGFAGDPEADPRVKSLNFSTSSFFLVQTATGSPTGKAVVPMLMILANTPLSVA